MGRLPAAGARMNARAVVVSLGFAWLVGAGPAIAGSASAASQSTPPLAQVTQVSAGGAHTCARRSVGDVQCWGTNQFGQLGNGGGTPAAHPVIAVGLETGMQAVSSGVTHNCALTAAGGVKCWGNNPFGQLGDGTNLIRTTAVDVSGLTSGVQSVFAGGAHSCALTVGGQVKCWGNNAFGQLGSGQSATQLPSARSPVDVVGLGPGIQRLAVGFDHACVITAAGGVRCWGRNENQQLGSPGGNTETPRDVVGLGGIAQALALGRQHSCALMAGGRVRCWGGNELGQLGANNFSAARGPGDVLGLESGVQAIAAGALHTCALLQNGSVRCWGANFSSQLGENGANFAASPVEVTQLGGTAIAITAGGREEFNGHSCALLSGGTVRCWGSNAFGQLGNGKLGLRPIPAAVTGFSGQVRDLDGGIFHTCALSTAGAVRCWGFNARGQLGDGTFTHRATPTAVLGLGSDIQAIVTGGHFDHSHTCALTQAGGVRCWGANGAGQLGDGTTAQRTQAGAVSGLDSGVRAITAGDRHTCAVTNAGGVKCWGSDRYGQLGRGSTPSPNSTTPVDVQGLSTGVRQLVSGSDHNCALTEAGGVKCWGRNHYRQLGNGQITDSALPVDVQGLPADIVAITAGSEQSCAVTGSRAVLCWGRGDFGQLGEDSGTARTAPMVVEGLASGVAAVSSRGSTGSAPHSCALGTNGAVRCWGFNGAGMLGDGTTIGRTAPQGAVAGLSGVQMVKAGGQHVCAVVASGELRCWGDNTFGQLGNGSFGISAIPTDVITRPALRTVERLSARRTGGAGKQANVAGGATDGAAPGAGKGATGSIYADTDASGRYVVFQSDDAGLVSGDSNGSADIFRVDRQTGETVRVSIDDAEQQITGDSLEPSVSANGRLVAFVARDGAVNKLRGETAAARAARQSKADGWGVYLRNMLTGSSQRVGDALSGGSGTTPQISADGSSVVFTAVNTSTALGAVGQQEVFSVALTYSGDEVSVGKTTCPSCKSVAANGSDTAENSNGASTSPVVSADGQWVAWVTEASNSLASSTSVCTEASTAVMLRNLLTGAMQQVSAPTSSANCGTSEQGSVTPQMDFSGTSIVFASTQPLVSGDSNGVSDVYLYDTQSRSLTRVSDSDDGSDANAAATKPTISGDGMTVAFVAEATNLDPSEPDNNAVADVHVFSLRDSELQRVSQNSYGVQADDASLRPVLDYGGKSLVFDSAADNLEVGAGDTSNIYLRSNPLDPDYVYASSFE